MTREKNEMGTQGIVARKATQPKSPPFLANARCRVDETVHESKNDDMGSGKRNRRERNRTRKEAEKE